MRAKMSTGHGEGDRAMIYVAEYGSDMRSTAYAMAEARAILAETEGWDGSTYNGADRVEWNHFPHGHGMKAERSALADALRAFVEA